jgi:hypothetical protein
MTHVIQLFYLLVIALAGGLNRHQQAVIDYLIEENRVLKEQLEGQRIRLAVKAKVLGRRALDELETLVTPDTLLAWHRKLIAQKWTYERKGPGRPCVAQEITDLVVRMARENASWGYDRIQGALTNIGYVVAPNTVKNILKMLIHVAPNLVGYVARKTSRYCHAEFVQKAEPVGLPEGVPYRPSVRRAFG